MLMTPGETAALSAQRVDARARLVADRLEGRTRLVRRYQDGAARDPLAGGFRRSARGCPHQHRRRSDGRRPHRLGDRGRRRRRRRRHHAGLREGLSRALRQGRSQRQAGRRRGRAHCLAAAGNHRLRPLRLREKARCRPRRRRASADRGGHDLRPPRHGRARSPRDVPRPLAGAAGRPAHSRRGFCHRSRP